MRIALFQPHNSISSSRALFLLLFFLTASAAGPRPARAQAPEVFRMPSAVQTGSAIDDTIWVDLYRARATAPAGAAPRPAVILVHPIGQTKGDLLDHYMHRLAERFAEKGISCAFLTLPFHMERGLKRENNARHFIGPNADADVQALQQSSSDISTVFTWLSQLPGVDPHRIGVVGISLGAIVVHLAMGQDPRLTAGVALEGGGDLPNLFRHSLEVTLHGHFSAAALEAGRDKLRAVEPLAFASKNRPRRVLMLQAARDLYVPPHNATVLWEALGRPPIQWVDANHFSFLLAGASFADTATAYLNRVWDGHADDPSPLPRYRVPLLKVGLLSGLDSPVSPAISLQLLGLGTRRDHLTLVHIDVGLSGRGPFAGLAATVNPFIDVGVGRRLGGKSFRPYASVHFPF